MELIEHGLEHLMIVCGSWSLAKQVSEALTWPLINAQVLKAQIHYASSGRSPKIAPRVVTWIDDTNPEQLRSDSLRIDDGSFTINIMSEEGEIEPYKGISRKVFLSRLIADGYPVSEESKQLAGL